MIRKIVFIVIGVYLAWYAVTDPTGAAANLHQLGGLIAGAANGVAAFGSALTSAGGAR